MDLRAPLTANGHGDTQPRSQAKAYGLPDLTHKLVQYGVHEEYLEYRRKYLEWRSGGARGAKGELSVPALANADLPRYDFEVSLGTPQRFRFFFTVSYWQGVFSLQGALALTFVAALAYAPGGNDTRDRFSLLLSSLGSSFYLLACYGGYLELINLPQNDSGEDTDQVYLWPACNWQDVKKRVDWDSLFGNVSYFVGMDIWYIPVMCRLMPEWVLPAEFFTSENIQLFLRTADLLGGFGFWVGGSCEVSHSWRRVGPSETAWWAALFDCLGGFFFFFFAAARFPNAGYDEASRLGFFLGSVFYVVGSALCLRMWRANDFGLTLLGQLNHAIKTGDKVVIAAARKDQGNMDTRALRVSRRSTAVPNGFERQTSTANEEKQVGRSPTHSPRLSEAARPRASVVITSAEDGGALLKCSSNHGSDSSLGNQNQEAETADKDTGKPHSTRGVVFLCMYCWLCVCTAANSIRHLVRPESMLHHITAALMGLAWFASVQGVLVIHSVVTTCPAEQPYRCLMLVGRGILVVVTVVQTVTLAASMPDPGAPKFAAWNDQMLHTLAGK
eukprot:gnl/TRDRNA2_/TRDRNA2_42159_c0_seq1.p1 gnl/TRDRNA2_/TRDRNA2_42159_c0~~gnl/TRDRNA2_/TRDRNA2_42159_c0_seq1.p1  ORF type:complete len:558 (-),score=70.37 gnl/TRDRNA2_/TRDRNA2_42159_c0_seq1:63-1736(-)